MIRIQARLHQQLQQLIGSRLRPPLLRQRQNTRNDRRGNRRTRDSIVSASIEVTEEHRPADRCRHHTLAPRGVVLSGPIDTDRRYTDNARPLRQGQIIIVKTVIASSRDKDYSTRHRASNGPFHLIIAIIAGSGQVDDLGPIIHRLIQHPDRLCFTHVTTATEAVA